MSQTMELFTVNTKTEISTPKTLLFFGSDHEIKQRRSFSGKLVTRVFKTEMVVSRDNEQCGATEILIVDQMFETERISFQDMF